MERNGDRVRFHYTLEVDGEVYGSSRDRGPVELEIGSGKVVPGLEDALAGMRAGEKRVVMVPPHRGYGPHDPEGVQPVPVGAFAEEVDSLEVGQVVEGELNGTPFVARVDALREDEVVLDFNHPLAGRTLRFVVDMVDVDAAEG